MKRAAFMFILALFFALSAVSYASEGIEVQYADFKEGVSLYLGETIGSYPEALSVIYVSGEDYTSTLNLEDPDIQTVPFSLSSLVVSGADHTSSKGLYSPDSMNTIPHALSQISVSNSNGTFGCSLAKPNIQTVPSPQSSVAVSGSDFTVTVHLVCSLKPGMLVPGDINGNGRLDIQDALYIMGYLTGTSSLKPVPADMNGDGVIDVADVLIVSGGF